MNKKPSTSSNGSGHIIHHIEDKKKQGNGNISYLVIYKDDSNAASWAPKKYLQKQPHNKKVIERYEMTMKKLNLSFDEEEGERSSQNITTNSKTKIIKKSKHKPKTSTSNKQVAEETKNYGQFSKLLMKIFQQNGQEEQKVHNQESEDGIQSQQYRFLQDKPSKNQIHSKKNATVSLNGNNSKVRSSKLKLQHLTSVMEIGKKSLPQVETKSVKTYKIIRAKIDRQGTIEFQIEYQNGQQMWMNGDKVKKQNPMQVINFYEKRISWGC